MRYYIYNQRLRPNYLARFLPIVLLLSLFTIANVLYIQKIEKRSASIVSNSEVAADPKPATSTAVTAPAPSTPTLPNALPSSVPDKQKTIRPASGSASWQIPVNAEELLRQTNEARAKAGLNLLTSSEKLTQSATLKCRDMVTKNYWAHTDPDGNEPWLFMDRVGYKKIAAGENLAYGFNGTSDVVKGWLNSATHRAAILNTVYIEVGFGICAGQNYQDSGPQTIVVQHFGTPIY